MPSSSPLSVSDLVKSASAFSTWDGSMWKGSLATWDVQQTHLLKMASAASFTTSGPLVETVSVNPGWNWIAMASHVPLSIDDVMHSAGFAAGDLLKSASAFSTWGANGFQGSLSTLAVGSGYLLKCARAGTLTFGSHSTSHSMGHMGRRRMDASRVVAAPHRALASQSWASKLKLGDTSASLDVSVSINGVAVTSGTLAAFNSNGEVLGVASTSLDGVFSLSVSNPRFANSSDKSISETVTFRFDTGSQIVHLATTYVYQANGLMKLQAVAKVAKEAPKGFPWKWRRQ
jgi:hypothetical protein